MRQSLPSTCASRVAILLVAATSTVRRINQLQALGKQINIPVYEETGGNPVNIAANAPQFARERGYNPIIIDTAGRRRSTIVSCKSWSTSEIGCDRPRFWSPTP